VAANQPSAIGHQPRRRRIDAACIQTMPDDCLATSTFGVKREADYGRLHEAGGLEKGSRGNAGHLPRNVALAEARALRPNVAVSPRGRRDSSQSGRGCGKNSDAELAKHSRTSLGSASELSYYLILAHDLRYMDRSARDDHQESLSEVRRMLASLEHLAATAAGNAAPGSPLRRKSRRSGSS